MPAGAMPMPFNPNFTVTGPLTVAPFAGAMKYTSAPLGDGVRFTCANATPAATAPSRAKVIRALGWFILFGLRGTDGGIVALAGFAVRHWALGVGWLCGWRRLVGPMLLRHRARPL